MKKVHLLSMLIGFMGAFALLAVGSVFLGYLGPSQKAEVFKPFRELPLHEIDALQPGELKTGLGADELVMAYRPTEDQMAELRALDSSVYDSAMTSYHAELGVFFYWQRSTNYGCLVEHRPKDSHAFRTGWPGGFVDRCHDQSYDYAGRSIRDPEVSYYGYVKDVPNLYVPGIRIRRDWWVRIEGFWWQHR